MEIPTKYHQNKNNNKHKDSHHSSELENKNKNSKLTGGEKYKKKSIVSKKKINNLKLI
jgi:hypothetical protein